MHFGEYDMLTLCISHTGHHARNASEQMAQNRGKLGSGVESRNADVQSNIYQERKLPVANRNRINSFQPPGCQTNTVISSALRWMLPI